MVVDDHELVRYGISRIISDEPDMDVIAQAASGEEVLRLLRNVPADVVLLDVTMPGMSGIESTGRIARLYPDVRIIAMSPLESGLIPTRMLRAGAVAFLTKNVSVIELNRAAESVIGRSEEELMEQLSSRL